MLPVRLTSQAFDDIAALPQIGRRSVFGGLASLQYEPDVGELLWRDEGTPWVIRFVVLDPGRVYVAAYLTDDETAVEVQAVGRMDTIDLLLDAAGDLVQSLESESRPAARALLEYLQDTDDQVVREIIRIRLGQPRAQRL